MELQLQRGKTNHYCFVTDCASLARGTGAHARGALTFNLEFVRAERITPDPHSDVDNIPEGAKTMTASELGAWWDANPQWRVVGT